MWKTKFWLIQIVMLVMVSLVFGSAAFAGPPEHSKGKGVVMSKAHASQVAQTNDKVSDNAAFYEEASPPPPPVNEEEEDEFAQCVDSGQVIFNADGTITFCP